MLPADIKSCVSRGAAKAAKWCAAIALMVAAPAAWAQTSSATPELELRMQQLQQELRQTRSDLAHTQQQLDEVLRELRDLRHDLVGTHAVAMQSSSPGAAYQAPADATSTAAAVTNAQDTGDDIRENQALLAQQLEEQQQTKVESASKYRVKLSGLILMNAFNNSGAVDLPDLANRAAGNGAAHSLGATLRQSVFGLQVFGPAIAGAQSSGSVSVDFFGGMPTLQYGHTNGILRLREATGRLDWRNTSLIVGQQAPFFSPLSPTSYATLAEPALSWSGNLWVWTPQVQVEHRFRTSDDAWFAVSGGVLVPLTEAVPDSSQFPGVGPGEKSRRPAFATHVSWNAKTFGQPLTIGVGAYTSHLNYTSARQADAWAVTGDWRLPLGKHFEFSGEGYRGRAVGGLGAGIWQSAVYDGDPTLASTRFRPLNATGGWGQIKFRPAERWEMNTAIGQDNVFARDLRWAPVLTGESFRPLARNRVGFTNAIFRPRSNLLLALEYRRIWTFPYIGAGRIADQVNMGAGVSF